MNLKNFIVQHHTSVIKVFVQNNKIMILIEHKNSLTESEFRKDIRSKLHLSLMKPYFDPINLMNCNIKLKS